MNSIESNELIKKAKDYAYSVHKNDTCILTQKNKIQHIEAVVKKVSGLGLKDDNLIILAYLHDVLDYAQDEFTREKIRNDITNIFGSYMLKLVEEVSDNFRIEDISNPSSNDAFKKRMLVIKSPEGICATVAKVTLAEKVCNLNDMSQEIQKIGRTYWKRLESEHGLKKSDVREYYDTIYDIISFRCYGDRRLRKMIDEFDDLIFTIFN